MEHGAGSFQWKKDAYSFENAFISPNHRHVCYGLPQWGSPEWKGTFYKNNTQPKDFLREYAQRVDCVEVSSTFYSPVSVDRITQWTSSVPEGFRFLPKWPKLMTHQNFLNSSKEELLEFVETLRAFGKNLGTSFIQLPPQFSIEWKRQLFYFLREIPEDIPVCLEFRHNSWFEDHRVYSDLEKYLAEQGIGMVITDTPRKRDVFHLSFTGSRNIVRFLSDDDSTNDEIRLGLWREFIDSHNNLGQIYFTLHKVNNTTTPELLSIISPETAKAIDDANSERQQSLI